MCATQRQNHECDQKALRNGILEDHVGEWLETVSIPGDWHEQLERVRRAAQETPEAPKVDTSAMQARLARLNDLYEMGSIDRAEYLEESRPLKASVEAGRPRPFASTEHLEAAAGFLADLAAMWASASPKHRHQLVQRLFREVPVKGDSRDHVITASPKDDVKPLLAVSAAQVGMVSPQRFEL